MRKESMGFTLVELMIVITVIAILATLSLYGLGRAQAAARDTSRQQIMSSIRSAIERYYADSLTYYPGTASNGDFCSLVFTLVTAGYLPGQPKDPGGGGTTNICSASTDGNRYANGAMYDYVASPSAATTKTSYQLKLAKEAGGYSLFYNPQ